MPERLPRFEEVKASVPLKEYADSVLDHVRGGLVCPVCGSGKGPSKTPAFSTYEGGTKWKCFSCGNGGDIFDLAGYVNGTDNRLEQLRDVCLWAGIPFDGSDGTSRSIGSGDVAGKTKTKTETESASDTSHSSGRGIERDYIKRCKEAMTRDCAGMEYMKARGFTAEDVERFGVGWDEEKRSVILPWSTRPGEWYHIDRVTYHDGKGKYDKPPAWKVGSQPLFNPQALESPVVYVVEGVLDAYAVMSCGRQAIALAGASNRAFIKSVIERGYRGVIVLMLDFDATGDEHRKPISDELSEAGVMCLIPDEQMGEPWETEGPDGSVVKVTHETSAFPYKDACEALKSDRGALSRLLDFEDAQAQSMAREEQEKRYAEAMKRLRVMDPTDAVIDLYTLADSEEPTDTGIAGLDRALDGGLRRGVYVLGAISSLGKTTLSVQVADHIAERGRPVLFVTIEQSAREIVAKSVTRILRQSVDGPDGLMSTRTLMSREKRDGLSDKRKRYLDNAFTSYVDGIAPNMRILEGTEQPSVSDILSAAGFMSESFGVPPVVFIDYLQLLKPDSDRMTEKQATDHNMMALRQMARDLKTTVFVISSLNRSSYSGAISLDSFKESGGIEYGADVLLGLQPFRMGEQLDAVTETKRRAEAVGILKRMKERTERPCEIVVLKQRSGSVPSKGIPVTFRPVPSLFTDGIDGECCD